MEGGGGVGYEPGGEGRKEDTSLSTSASQRRPHLGQADADSTLAMDLMGMMGSGSQQPTSHRHTRPTAGTTNSNTSKGASHPVLPDGTIHFSSMRDRAGAGGRSARVSGRQSLVSGPASGAASRRPPTGFQFPGDVDLRAAFRLPHLPPPLPPPPPPLPPPSGDMPPTTFANPIAHRPAPIPWLPPPHASSVAALLTAVVETAITQGLTNIGGVTWVANAVRAAFVVARVSGLFSHAQLVRVLVALGSALAATTTAANSGVALGTTDPTTMSVGEANNASKALRRALAGMADSLPVGRESLGVLAAVAVAADAGGEAVLSEAWGKRLRRWGPALGGGEAVVRVVEYLISGHAPRSAAPSMWPTSGGFRTQAPPAWGPGGRLSGFEVLADFRNSATR